MSRASEHIASEVHRADAKHHRAMAKSKRNRATIARAMHKEAGMSADTQSSHSRMADALDHEAELHEAHADHHEDAAEKCDKAAGDSMNKIVPDGISGINRFPAGGITPVPRYGAPDRSQKPNVPIEFEKLVSIEEDD
jgi:hypothetical protein